MATQNIFGENLRFVRCDINHSFITWSALQSDHCIYSESEKERIILSVQIQNMHITRENLSYQ